jgi:hypothetical protein
MDKLEWLKSFLPARKKIYKYRYRVVGGYVVNTNNPYSTASRYTSWFCIKALSLGEAKTKVKQRLGPRVIFEIKESK